MTDTQPPTPPTGAEVQRQLSRLLFESRELISMLSDIVESRTGQLDTWGRRVREEIDLFRERQGWSPDGFGGETDDPRTPRDPENPA